MCVCVCVCVCVWCTAVYTHTHTHTHTQIWTDTDTEIHTHTHTHTYIHSSVDRVIHTETQKCTETHTHTKTETHTHIQNRHRNTHIHINNIPKCAHTCKHTHTHTHTHSYQQELSKQLRTLNLLITKNVHLYPWFDITSSDLCKVGNRHRPEGKGTGQIIRVYGRFVRHLSNCPLQQNMICVCVCVCVCVLTYICTLNDVHLLKSNRTSYNNSWLIKKNNGKQFPQHPTVMLYMLIGLCQTGPSYLI